MQKEKGVSEPQVIQIKSEVAPVKELGYNLAIKEMVVKAINQEYEKAAGNEELLEWLASLYLTTKLHAFLNPRSLAFTASKVFSSDTLSSFVLDLTVNISFRLTDMEKSSSSTDSLIENIIKGVTISFAAHNLAPSSNSGERNKRNFMPASISESLMYEPGFIEKTLNNEKWILTLVFLLMYLDSTEMYTSIKPLLGSDHGQ